MPIGPRPTTPAANTASARWVGDNPAHAARADALREARDIFGPDQLASDYIDAASFLATGVTADAIADLRESLAAAKHEITRLTSAVATYRDALRQVLDANTPRTTPPDDPTTPTPDNDPWEDPF